MRKYKQFETPKRKTKKRFACEEASPIYNSIRAAKKNDVLLENGDTRIGHNMVVNKTTSIIYKLV